MWNFIGKKVIIRAESNNGYGYNEQLIHDPSCKCFKNQY